jgi:hypothetical protein
VADHIRGFRRHPDLRMALLPNVARVGSDQLGRFNVGGFCKSLEVAREGVRATTARPNRGIVSRQDGARSLPPTPSASGREIVERERAITAYIW